MNPVQNGGVPPQIETYIDDTWFLIRPFLDQRYWKEDWHKAMTRFFAPGTFHHIYSTTGYGKTSMAISLMQSLLTTDLGGERKWAFLTNQFFEYIDEEGNAKVAYPKGVHHFHTMKHMFEKTLELKAQGYDVAIVMDDFGTFFSSSFIKKQDKKSLAESLRNLICYRKKLGIMVWLVSGDDYEEFVHLENRSMKADLEWYGSPSTANTDAMGAKVSFPVRDTWYVSSDSTSDDFLIERKSWAYDRSEKKKGFFFDRTGSARVTAGDGFDLPKMFEKLDNTPVSNAWSVVSEYLEKSNVPAPKSNTDRDTEIAVRLKNIGLTDEAIEWALSTPKTTLRRHAEKRGDVWEISDKQPYLFKKVKASERAAFVEDLKQDNST